MQHTSENMQFLYSGHYYEGQLTNCREFITINYPPPLGFLSFLPMAHLAPCLTLTGRPCFYSRKSFEVFLLCSVQVTEFQLEYLMHACSSDFAHYGNMKLSPSLIHQARIQAAGGPCIPPALSRSQTCHQTSDQ